MEALQLSLLSSVDMPARVFSVLEGKGVYTGARLRAQRPEVYAQCVALLQEGVTPLAIEEALGIEHRTVEAVAAANAIPIQTSKRRMGERFRFAADRLLDQVHETSDAREAKDLMIAASCATDKWQLLEGQPTSRSVDIDVKVESKDWNDWIGLAASNPPANGPLLDTTTEPTSDSESDAGACGDGALESEPASCIPNGADPGLEPGPRDSADGGGGGQAAPPAPPAALDASEGGNFPTKGAV